MAPQSLIIDGGECRSFNIVAYSPFARQKLRNK
jgi:hypothetical protein